MLKAIKIITIRTSTKLLNKHLKNTNFYLHPVLQENIVLLCFLKSLYPLCSKIVYCFVF